MRVSVFLGCILFAVATSAAANAAESWVYGIGSNKVAAKQVALEVASANLPVGVPFYVVEENYVADNSIGSAGSSVPSSYTCNLLVRYGTGMPAGMVVFHAYNKAEREVRTERANKSAKTAGASGTTKASHAKTSTGAYRGPANASHAKASTGVTLPHKK